MTGAVKHPARSATKNLNSGASVARHSNFLPIPAAVCLHFEQSDNNSEAHGLT
jgi:hypothetical protein